MKSKLSVPYALSEANCGTTATERISRRRSLRLQFALLGVSLAAAPIFAQFAPPPPSRPFPGFANERLRSENVYMSAWDIGASYRVRYETKTGAGFTDAGSNWDFSERSVDDTDNSYLLSRLMPRVAYTGKRLAFTLEGRASASIGDERFNAT